MIKNIIFDLGNVLINFENNRFFTLGGHDVKRAVPLMNEFDKGKISKFEFYAKMKKLYNFDFPQTDFENIWCDNFWENTEMIDFARKLSSKYGIFILSNTDEIHFPFIWKTFPSLHIFDGSVMVSYKLGLLKPNPEIYAKALSIKELNPEECIFIDDKLVNVEAAEKIGIRSIFHVSNKKTIEKVSNHLT